MISGCTCQGVGCANCLYGGTFSNANDIGALAYYIHEWANRTFPGRPPRASLVKLVMEEVPEMLDHLKARGPEGIGPEWADCMILLLDLARIWNIDPGQAIRDKMAINQLRMWKKDEETGFYNHVVARPVVEQKGYYDRDL
jgi:NTP pyrophosphatase (non-canonical NTP hydrolase)